MEMPYAEIFKGRFLLSISVTLFLLVPLTAHPHEGELDSYGCHYDNSRRNYHCHQGELSGRTFKSKIEVIQLLSPENRKRVVLPGKVVEKDITPAEVETKQEPAAGPREEIRNEPSAANSEVPAPSRQADPQQIRPAKSKSKQETPVRKEATEPKSKQPKGEQLHEWIVNIRPDGLVIYENSIGERYYLDDNGKKVYVRRKR